MQKGEEPLRSFGDLMQFYTPPAGGDEANPAKANKKKKKADNSSVASDAASTADAPVDENTIPSVGIDAGGEGSPSADSGTNVTPPPSSESAPQVEPASQTEPAPPAADQEGSESSTASDKPAS